MSTWYILNTIKDSFDKEWYSGECDSDILMLLKNIVRNKKIDKLLK